MRLTDPIPWALVPIGAQVLLHGDSVPRTVMVNTSIVVMIEGLKPMFPVHYDTVRMVIPDEGDAIATLAAAGLNPEIIETRDAP